MSEGSWYVRPVFFVSNCEDSLRFYQRLGFSESWRAEDEGELVVLQVERNDVEIILNRDLKKKGQSRIFLSLEKGVLPAWEKQLQRESIDVHDGFWGMPVKSIRDPDGNEILCSSDDLVASGVGPGR